VGVRVDQVILGDCLEKLADIPDNTTIYKKIASDKLAKIKKPTLYQDYPVSIYLGKIQSIRDADAKKLFPRQLTSTEKKRRKTKADPLANGHQTEPLPFLDKLPSAM
jgi:hypothetical protein